MKTVKLTPKASEDLENIWHYGWQHFGEIQADRYINHLSEIFSIMSANNIGTPRPELGEYGTVAKLAMRQPFVLFKGLTFQKLCLP
ncbi:type II toxin-antitoxin system RelE/ParE family toxin, partial [Salmonella enterica]|uniref:type II toxin-antitoxin system RelE/ParE family toxin n=1 Tax=Salmonella enterica TaxID=28901 RepID=UPI001CCB7D56